MDEFDWYGLYGTRWGAREVTPAAVLHPAKYNRGLITKIYAHLQEHGYLAPGARIVDPFGGIGMGGLPAALLGMHWLGVELEPRFVEIGTGDYMCSGTAVGMTEADVAARRVEQSLCPWHEELWRIARRGKTDLGASEPHRFLGNIPYWYQRFAGQLAQAGGSMALVQGDSRRLGSIVREVQQLVVSSPPYLATRVVGNGDVGSVDLRAADGGYVRGKDGWEARKALGSRYGATPGQLGTMPAGDFDATVGSPPFGQSLARETVNKEERRRLARALGISNAEHVGAIAMEKAGLRSQGDYGAAAGQLGAMPPGDYDAAVGSPPYASALSQGNRPADYDYTRYGGGGQLARGQTYGTTEGQLGKAEPATFWEATRQIMEEVYAILRPGGVAVWVTGDYLKNRQRVPFGAQWRQLGEACGLTTVQWIRAWKIKETRRTDMFGAEVVERTEHLGMFRRRENLRNPHNAIEHEDVFVMVKE